ncbi:MAG: hypothetical protein R2820_12140 [Cyclobacteriaceae bacterium]
MCVLTILISFQSLAQSIPTQTQIYVAQLHQSQSASVPPALREEKNAKEIIASASQYFNDTLSRVRSRMYSLVGDAGSGSKDQNLRRQAVSKLVNATHDSENLDLLLSKLSSFAKSDFNSSSTDTLVSLFRRKPPYLDQLARLVGTLQISELKEDLRTLSGPSTKNQRIRWSALVALARMGDDEALKSMMRRAQRLPVNDDIVYEVFPDLVYTRQRQAIDYLIVELKSDEKKCTTADAEDEAPITCAYRIMEMLAPVIDKYPLQVDASGDIKTKDYNKSLKSVREWFTKNQDYKILE